MSRFERLYRDNFPFVWAAARRCGAPSHAVDDVVQDVFVTAYRRIDELHYEVSPRGWLYGVTRRVAFRYRRSAARQARRHVAFGQASRGCTQPHAELEAVRDLERLLQQIDEAQREAFVMVELLGMSGPEIAGELGVPVDTVYSRLRLARRRLSLLAGSAERLHAGVAHARAVERPAETQQARTWAAIVPLIGAKSIAIPMLSSAAVKSAWVSGSIAAAAVVVAVLQAGAEPAPAALPHARAEERAGQVATAARAPLEEPTAASMAALASEEESTSHALAVASSRAAAPTTASSASTRSLRASSRGSLPEAPPEDLAQELALLDRANAAVARGEPRQALDALGEHRRRFPRGQLAEARRATRVQVLCDLGRVDAAREEAAALRREHPDSALAARSAKTCDRS